MESDMNKAKELGGSISVDNVQALATKELKEIPHRYIRPELESDVVSIDESREIPVIDLCKLLDEEFASDELAKLRSACEDWGFFQLVNHGASEEIIAKMKISIQEFFRQPLEVKKSFSQLPNSMEGYGQAFVVSKEQKLDWADMLFLVSSPISERNFTFWPTNPTSFRETLSKYSLELQRVTVRLVRFMAKNLGVEPDMLANMFANDGSQTIRMNYYPPCPQRDKVLGLSPHSDGSGLTLLIQVNEVEGLQIRKNGSWVPVKPVAGAFIVNIGDVIEIMSNGKYKSIEHRAVIDPVKERLSIAAFHGPNLNTMIGPLPDLVKKNEQLYMTVNYEDYVEQLVSSKLDGKSALDSMKLEK